MARPRPHVAANPDSRDQRSYRRGDDGPGGGGGHGGGSGYSGGETPTTAAEETAEAEEARLVEVVAREAVRIRPRQQGRWPHLWRRPR